MLFERAERRLDAPAWSGSDHSLADELLLPSVIYAPAVLALREAHELHGVAHITGGGIPGNLGRVLPDGCGATLWRDRWSIPPIFSELQLLGAISDDEMAHVFNMGIGMILLVGPATAAPAIAGLARHGVDAQVIGEVVAGRGVRFSS